jgi:hypothetical protein
MKSEASATRVIPSYNLSRDTGVKVTPVARLRNSCADEYVVC